jgi:RNA polymerase sigma factor (sigma-70 family)
MEPAATVTERVERREPALRGTGIPPFQAFLDQHRDLVYRFLLASVGANDVDDCFQETFLAALRAYPRLRHGDNLRGWVMAIATRKAIDSARDAMRRPQPVADVPDVPAAEDPWQTLEGSVSLALCAGDGSMWDDVMGLPTRQRVALVHRVLLDRPYAELAAAMGTSVDAARANVYQALRKLREGRIR